MDDRFPVASRRRLVILAGAVVALVVVAGFARASGRQGNHPIDVPRSEIVAVTAHGGGPGLPGFVPRPGRNQLPLGLVIGRVPIPLPSPDDHGVPCRCGGVLTVKLSDGRVITYGPHGLPARIDRLWGAIVVAYQLTLAPRGLDERQSPELRRVAAVWLSRGGRREDVYAAHPRPGQRPIRLVSSLVVNGLTQSPTPLHQPSSCHRGDTLVVRYTSGRMVTYGPCIVDPFVENLWGGMLQAAAESPAIT
jgi:hypothetical protein